MKRLKLKRKAQEGEKPKEGKPKNLPKLLPQTGNAKKALLLAGLLGVGALALLLARPKPAPSGASFQNPPESRPPVAPPSPPPPPVVGAVPPEGAPPPEPSPEPPVVATPAPAPEALPAPSSSRPIPKNPFRLLGAEKPKEVSPSKPPPLPPPPEALPPLPAPPPPAPQAEEERPKLVALTMPSPPGKPVAVLTWKGMKYTLALGEEVKGLGKLVKVETPCITLKDKKALKVCLKEE